MSSENNTVLRLIMDDLKSGYSYGRDFTFDHYNNKPLRYPYFDAVLRLSPDGRLIRWQHFGSSANKCTLKDLNWIITEIFKTTPVDFIREYIRNDKSGVPN